MEGEKQMRLAAEAVNMHEYNAHSRYYRNTIIRINQMYDVPDDLCFVYVQHAFSPLIRHLSCVEERLAAIIPKGSSAKANPKVISQLKLLFRERVRLNATREYLKQTDNALQLLRDVTRGRRFAILEYGGYFAPAAEAISSDSELGSKLVGIVEGTENGIRGASDGTTLGYQQVAAKVKCPIVSKSKSNIKQIMDLGIGPAIVRSTDAILGQAIGCKLTQWQGSVGVVGLGAIGRGVFDTLREYEKYPLVYDTSNLVMAEMASRQCRVASQKIILSTCDILFLNTGSCFLSQQPSLLKLFKDNAIVVLCTSGDVEAGIPQLVAANHLTMIREKSDDKIAVFKTRYGKNIRLVLGRDGVGQAPNMFIEDGSGSQANLMSDMEFYGVGAYLGSSKNDLPVGCISKVPQALEDVVIDQWLRELYPVCLPTSEMRPKKYPESLTIEAN